MQSLIARAQISQPGQKSDSQRLTIAARRHCRM
jgi:hypothetical protein